MRRTAAISIPKLAIIHHRKALKRPAMPLAALVLTGMLAFAACQSDDDEASSSSAKLAAPQNVVGQANFESVALRWDDVRGAAGYYVFQDSSASVDANDTKSPLLVASRFDQDNLPPGGYFYRVAAVDSSVRLGELSPTVRVAVPEIPGNPFLLPAPNLRLTVRESSVVLAWEAIDEAAGYRVLWNTHPDLSLNSPRLETLSTGIEHGDLLGGSYFYRAGALSETGILGHLSDAQRAVLTASTVINTPPLAPQNLEATRQGLDIVLSWPPNEAPVAGYRLFWQPQEASLSAATQADWPSVPLVIAGPYVFPTRTSGVHSFRLAAVNASGQASEPVPAADGSPDSTPDHLPLQIEVPELGVPSALASASFDILTVASDEANLEASWEALTEAASYRLHWNTLPAVDASSPFVEVPDEGTTTLSFSLNALPSAIYSLRVAARDAQGRHLRWSHEQRHEHTSPLAVEASSEGSITTLQAEVIGPTVYLHWEPQANARAYRVLWDLSSPLDPLLAEGLPLVHASSLQHRPQLPGAYTYLVHFLDAQGRWSSGGTEVSVRIFPEEGLRLAAPTNLRGTLAVDPQPPLDADGQMAVQVILTWNAVERAAGYRVYLGEASDVGLDGASSPLLTQPGYTHAGLRAGSWVYRVIALDARGQAGPLSDLLTCNIALPLPAEEEQRRCN